jgi:hypothetical protein
MTEGISPATRSEAASEAGQQAHLIDLIELADEYYRRRGDAEASSPTLYRSAVLLESYRTGQWAGQPGRLASAIDSYELAWRLSRALFLDGEKSSELYARGALHGRRAVELESKRVEGHFWMGVNLALRAQARKGLRGALALLESRAALRRAGEVSEDYHGAGPLRVLGRLEHKSPRVLGGSLSRSLRYYERALAIAPANTVTLVYAAELEIDRSDFKRAALLLETIIGLPVDPDWEFENIRDKNLAKSMLRRLRVGVDDNNGSIPTRGGPGS